MVQLISPDRRERTGLLARDSSRLGRTAGLDISAAEVGWRFGRLPYGCRPSRSAAKWGTSPFHQFCTGLLEDRAPLAIYAAGRRVRRGADREFSGGTPAKNGYDPFFTNGRLPHAVVAPVRDRTPLAQIGRPSRSYLTQPAGGVAGARTVKARPRRFNPLQIPYSRPRLATWRLCADPASAPAPAEGPPPEHPS